MTPLRIIIPVLLALAACGPRGTPKDRYVRAMTLNLEGDSRAAYDELIALAHDSPDTRAGRRARAIVSGSSLITEVAVLASLASLVRPQVEGFSSEGQKAEAKVALGELAKVQHAHRKEHGRFCTTFDECAWKAPRRSTYFFYLSPNEVVGGTGLEDAALLRIQANDILDGMNLAPEVRRDRFLVMAVGDPDDDGDLEIWSIDEDDNLANLIKDD